MNDDREKIQPLPNDDEDESPYYDMDEYFDEDAPAEDDLPIIDW